MKKGWPRKTLGEVCQFRGGGTPSKAVERYWRGDIPWVSPKDMKFDVVSESIDHISQEALIAELDKALTLPGVSNAWTMPVRGRIAKALWQDLVTQHGCTAKYASVDT